MSSQAKDTAKKTYTTPELVVYGDVRELTLTVGNRSTVDDGGRGSTDKTA